MLAALRLRQYRRFWLGSLVSNLGLWIQTIALGLQRFNGVVEQASEQELADEAARADRTGMFNCPHTGVALAALRKLVDRKVIRSGERVVVISTANGLKFADQKAAYHMGTLEGVKPTHRNKPVELPADPKRVARAIARHVEKARLLVS